jgi:hypothetical protein
MPVGVSLDDPLQPLRHKYIVLSGVIADTPFTATLSKGLGHSGKRASRHCFVLGQRVSRDGSNLGATRFLGYAESTSAERIEVHDGEDGINSEAEWKLLDSICYCDSRGNFDMDVLSRIRIKPEHSDILVQTAESILIEAAEKYPNGDRLGGVDESDWQRGMGIISVLNAKILNSPAVRAPYYTNAHI